MPDKHAFPSVHRGIVRAAVYTLRLDGHPAADMFTDDTAEILIAEADAPDQMGDRQQGMGLHYFCAAKPDGSPRPLHPMMQGFCNGRSSPAPSLLTMGESEYRTALALESAGRHEAAMRSLSRALHFLADCCCPPHTLGLSYFSRYGSDHKRYEAEAARIFWQREPADVDEAAAAQSWAADAAGHVPYAHYEGLLQGTVPIEGGSWKPGLLAERMVQLANSGAAEREAVLGDDAARREASIRRRLLLSVCACTAMLAAFAGDLSKPQVWRSHQPYWLKAAGTAFLVTEEPLFLQFDAEGMVMLCTRDGRVLSTGRFGPVSLTKPIAGREYRWRFGKEPLLTLYPAGDMNRLLALRRGMLCCISRPVSGKSTMPECGFALMKQQPQHCRALLL